MRLEQLSAQGLMTREWLVSIRKMALRRRAWFGVLSRIERSAVELTIRYVDEIRSAKLALAIGRIACKIANALKSRFLERVDAVGYNIAERISRIAVGWGYLGALGWKRDLGFIRYLGLNAVGNSSGWVSV